jgi:hypothetical protein
MKFVRSIIPIVAIIGLLALNTGCYKDNKETMYPRSSCDTTNVTWSKDIRPIINASCAFVGCHNADRSGGYNLSNFEGVKAMVDNNRFLAVIESGSMPKNATKLDNCTINKVRSWINKGALEN